MRPALLLKRGFAAMSGVAMSFAMLAGSSLAMAQNAIQVENQKPGTAAWQIGLYPYVNSNDTDQWIRGYASATSINKGEQITLNITANPYSWKVPPQYSQVVPFTIDVYRIG